MAEKQSPYSGRRCPGWRSRLFGASAPNRFQGVIGWKRYFGAITVGVSIRETAVIVRSDPRSALLAREEQFQRQKTVLQHLEQDECFRNSVSYFGQAWLDCNSWKTTVGRNKSTTALQNPTTMASLPDSLKINLVSFCSQRWIFNGTVQSPALRATCKISMCCSELTPLDPDDLFGGTASLRGRRPSYARRERGQGGRFSP